MTLYLEKQGYNRETISKKVLDLIRKDILDWVQSWTTTIHPTYEGKEYIEIGFIGISEKEPKIISHKEEDISRIEKIKKLSELSKEELLDLQNNIKIILRNREIDTETMSHTIKHLCRIYFEKSSIRYTKLTLYLEKAGFKRESISRETLNMAGKNMFNYSTGLPLEEETIDNPLSPVYEGRHYPIYFIYCER